MKSKSLSIEELLNLSCPLNGFEFNENQMLALTKSNFKIIEGEYEADQDLSGRYSEIRDCVNKKPLKKMIISPLYRKLLA